MAAEVVKELAESVASKGFEVYSFKVGWYNENVQERFHLHYTYNTLAVVLLSTPSMFELNFIPFLRQSEGIGYSRDPLDQSVTNFVEDIKQDILKDEVVDVFYDYELDPRTRRPKILVQTAGHVAGAAFFYQQQHISAGSSVSEKLFGVSVHPIYGGWFAFRAVLVLPKYTLPANLPLVEPPDVVPTDEDRQRLLRLFNGNWKDNQYRNVVTPKTQYSNLQQEYFGTMPKNREEIIAKILQSL